MENITIFFYLLLNVLSSIGVIIINKFIYEYGIVPNITLTFIHFVTTFLGLYICAILNVLNVKYIHVKELLVLALSFCGFVVLTNLSLQYNSVGTYQVTKMLTTPGVMFIQMCWYRKQFSLGVKFTVVPIVAGIIISNYADVEFNVIGTSFAVLGGIITSVYQVLVHAKQKELEADPMQLLLLQAPLSAFFLCFVIPVFESPAMTITRVWSIHDMLLLVFSCLAAFFTNITIYWIIGNTSPLTYNMLGHTKFILINIVGWYSFNYDISVNQLLGIGLTFLGVIFYTHIKMKENEKAAAVKKLQQTEV